MKLKMKKSKIKNLIHTQIVDSNLTPNVAGGMPVIETRSACKSNFACTGGSACLS
ncbi:hypothetical protein L1077_04860 [Pseudoalteromonas luteoviolacea]|uniref:Uncharacterized protein n=1 Tax=Pseudoalteromonas luteoviolacea H33 TaxID=1365251 RepID=A0A161Y1A7_9GAMM|nr:hypothetical protein [Pseudoalteromonas luteoviolacea]KZN49780.1 hypothetical protein N476_18480 [Pseudoalteromonas luteoviolacea H33]KZN77804.1 hypothetical protein N477_00935 [Pseudoalteromonas luteoviolacea H33-S]MBQ4880407.1 hypothetical protein [Pseudoalteromonas luteoviolacea]MBQ4909468.1 hypothetical protein [Pseudoalteromonas luteoviolacea]MCF6438760.1 hypothetical protein [Pseudoalteromonas luteoviolacea]